MNQILQHETGFDRILDRIFQVSKFHSVTVQHLPSFDICQPIKMSKTQVLLQIKSLNYQTMNYKRVTETVTAV